jgi:hypothetical protein
MGISTGAIIIKTSGKRHYRHYVTRVQTVGGRDYYWARRIYGNVIKGNEHVVCDSEAIKREGRHYGFKVESE